MEKKFLDKQGLADLYKSLKDKFARKSDVPVKVSQLKNDENYLQPDTFLDSLCDSGNGFNVLNIRTFPLIDVLKNPAQINEDWNNIILTNGVKAYLSSGVLNSPNGDGTYIVFTSIRLVDEDNNEVYKNFVRGRLQPFIVAFHLETGRVFKRTFQPNLENNSSLHLVHFDEWFVNGYTAKEWSSWKEVTKDFVMKDQLEKALSEKAKKSDIPTKVSQLDNDKNYLSASTIEHTSLFSGTIITHEDFNVMPFKSGVSFVHAGTKKIGRKMVSATNFPCGLGDYVVYTVFPYVSATGENIYTQGNVNQVIVYLDAMRAFKRVGVVTTVSSQGIVCNWGELSEIKTKIS